MTIPSRPVRFRAAPKVPPELESQMVVVSGERETIW
jgi:hypothetical protein